MARTASAPLARASSTIRSMTWLRLSISAVVIPRSSPPTNDLNWAPSWEPMLRARTVRPKTSPSTSVTAYPGRSFIVETSMTSPLDLFGPAYGGSAVQPCSSWHIRPRSQRAGTASATASATRDRVTSSVVSPATAEQGHQFVGTRRAEPKRVQAYRDAHRPGSRGWLDLDADHAGRRPVHQPAAPPAVNSPASDGSAVPRDRAYRLAGDPSPKPPPHLDPHRVPVHPYPGPGRTEPEQRQQREQQGGVADGEERVGHDVTVRPLGRTPRSRHPRASASSEPTA